MSEVVVNELDQAELVLVPAGAFLAGSVDDDPEAYDDEKPQRTVELAAFEIYRYPVTNAQFARFVEASNHRLLGNWSDEMAAERPDHPATEVAHADALAYCGWAGVRLPAEWEWEKAARGADGRKFPWGDDFDGSLGNTRQNEGLTTTSVTAYPAAASPFGCLDMAGNTWDWTQSEYDDGSGRAVVRGGSFW